MPCLVGSARRPADAPPEDIIAWCKAMTKADRVKCIYEQELAALRKQAEASAT